MKKTGKIVSLLCLTTAAIGTIHIINKSITAYAKKIVLKSKPHYEYFKWRFGNIAYTVSGSGSPLLLIHDLNPLFSGNQWKKLIDKYAVNHTVYVIDLLGCGHSDKPAITYTSYLYVQMISDFIKDVIKNKTDVIVSGTSCGFITMACSLHSDLFNKIAFVNPDSFSSNARIPDKNSKLAKFLFEIPIIGTMVYNMNFSKSQIEKMLQTDYFLNPQDADSECVQTCYQNAHLYGANAKYLFASLTGKYQTANIYQAIKNIDNSIFILYGESTSNGQNIANEYVSANPIIETCCMKGAKFLPELEQPEDFLEATGIFFS